MTSDPINGWRMVQYVPDVLANPVVLRAVAPVPFVLAPLDQPSARRQYVPDVLANPVALRAVAPVPFAPAPLDQPSARRQYVPDVLANPVALSTVAPVAWSLAALNGIDSAPSSRLIGLFQISGTTVLQRIGTCIAGENYRVMATITTSIPQTLTLYAHCLCVAPS